MYPDGQRGAPGASEAGARTKGSSHGPEINPQVPKTQSFGFLPQNTTPPEMLNSSNTWTPSSGDFGLLDDGDDTDNRDDLIAEYNRLAEKYGVRSLVPADFAPIDERPSALAHDPKKKQGRGKHVFHHSSPLSSLPDRTGNWFYKVLRQTSPGASTNHLPSTYDQKHAHHQRSVSDRAWDMVRQQKNSLKNQDPAALVRLCGKSLFYLPTDYAPRPLVLPTCLRATAQALVQQANVQGIFRIPGSIKIIDALYDYYCTSSDVGDITRTTRSPTLPSHIRYTPHDIASVFKRILAGLPGGILGSLAVFDALVTIHSQLHAKPENVKTKETKLRARMIALTIGTIKSRYRRELICAVFGLLCLIGRAAENAPREDCEGRPLPTSDLMGYSALGILFGPLLVGDLIDFYSMKVADPAAGLVLLPLTSPKEPRKIKGRKSKNRKEKHNQKIDPNTPSVLGTIDKICLANNIAEMVITHWREVTRQLRSLDVLAVKSYEGRFRRRSGTSLGTSTSDGALMGEYPTGRSRSRSLSSDNALETLISKQQRMRSRSSNSSSGPSHSLTVHALSPTVEESPATNSLRSPSKCIQTYLPEKSPLTAETHARATHEHSQATKSPKNPQDSQKYADARPTGHQRSTSQPRLPNRPSNVALLGDESNKLDEETTVPCEKERGLDKTSFNEHKSDPKTTTLPCLLLSRPVVATDDTGGSVSEHLCNENFVSHPRYEIEPNEAGTRPSSQTSNTDGIRSPLSPPETGSSRGPSGYFDMIVPKRRKRAQKGVSRSAVSEPANKSTDGAHNMPKSKTQQSETDSVTDKSDTKSTRSDFKRHLRNMRARGKKKLAAFSPERKTTTDFKGHDAAAEKHCSPELKNPPSPPKGTQDGEPKSRRLSSRPSEGAVKNMAALFDSADKHSSISETTMPAGRASAEPNPSLTGGGSRSTLSTSKHVGQVTTPSRPQRSATQPAKPPHSDTSWSKRREEGAGVRESHTYPPYSTEKRIVGRKDCEGRGAEDNLPESLSGLPYTAFPPTAVAQAERFKKSRESSSQNQDGILDREPGRPINLGTRTPQPEEPPVAHHMKFNRPVSLPLSASSSSSPPQTSLSRRSHNSMQLHQTAWKLRRELERKKEECARLRRRLETREESLAADAGTLCEQLREARRERDAWRGRALRAERRLEAIEGGAARSVDSVAGRKGLAEELARGQVDRGVYNGSRRGGLGRTVDGSIDCEDRGLTEGDFTTTDTSTSTTIGATGDENSMHDIFRARFRAPSEEEEKPQRVEGNDGMGFSDPADGAGEVFEDCYAEGRDEESCVVGPSTSPVRVPKRGSSAARSSRSPVKGSYRHGYRVNTAGESWRVAGDTSRLQGGRWVGLQRRSSNPSYEYMG